MLNVSNTVSGWLKSAICVAMETSNQCQFAHVQRNKTWTREVILKEKCRCFFNNWERRDSQGVKITTVCHRGGHKPKSNGVAPTSATPDWLTGLPTSLMWFWMEQKNSGASNMKPLMACFFSCSRKHLRQDYWAGICRVDTKSTSLDF